VVFAVRRVNAGRRQRERERHAGRQSDAPLPAPLPSEPVLRASERRARITGLTGEHTGTSFLFGSTPIVIGSDAEADVRLARSPEVAARHAMLWVRDGKIMLRHTGGQRQTLSAGRQVDWVILEEGDEFSIGPYHYRVEPASMNGSGPSGGTEAST
jgi:hypothetical protein